MIFFIKMVVLKWTMLFNFFLNQSSIIKMEGEINGVGGNGEIALMKEKT